jgi:hypothetical protein
MEVKDLDFKLIVENNALFSGTFPISMVTETTQDFTETLRRFFDGHDILLINHVETGLNLTFIVTNKSSFDLHLAKLEDPIQCLQTQIDILQRKVEWFTTRFCQSCERRRVDCLCDTHQNFEHFGIA